ERLDRLRAGVGDGADIFLIPAALIHEARDLEGEVGGGVDWLAVHTNRYYVLPAPVNKVRCGRNPRLHPLRDKAVLVTGASSGIGKTAALRLAGLGCRVVLAARTQAALDEIAGTITGRGGQALAVATDVTDAAQCQRAVAAAVEHFGGLDILICSAGLSLRGYFEGTALDVLERVMRVNFFGT